MSCGPDCCDLSRPGWEFNFADIRAHVEKHDDGSCSCDACMCRFPPRTPDRLIALEACARAGLSVSPETNMIPGTSKSMPMSAASVPWWDPCAKAIDIACTEQILSGRYDNAKVANPAFVEAVRGSK